MEDVLLTDDGPRASALLDSPVPEGETDGRELASFPFPGQPNIRIVCILAAFYSHGFQKTGSFKRLWKDQRGWT